MISDKEKSTKEFFMANPDSCHLNFVPYVGAGHVAAAR